MAPNLPVRRSDLLGGTRLVTDATTAITDLVEAMHERIARPFGFPAPSDQGRTGGITGVVYRSIRGITKAVGLGVETMLETFLPPFGGDGAVPQREAAIAALNGVLGDHLVASGNPLAKPMALRRDGLALPLDRAALAASLPDAKSGIFVMIHGLCMGDLQLTRAGRDRDAELAGALGLTALRLDYNTGLHVSDNGRALADRLEALLDLWPQSLERIVLTGHSMGGLVARSAFRQGEDAGHRWPGRVSDMVFLGSPHHGAPLEKAGHWIDVVLGATPYAAPFARLGRVRSAGISDMRHGRLLAEDRHATGPFGDPRRPVPLPETVRSWAIAARLGIGGDGLGGALVGDGLVPVDSALGRHSDPARHLAFPPERQRVIDGLGHIDMLWDDRVWAQMRGWLGPDEVPTATDVGA
jgi:hypothetical protein